MPVIHTRWNTALESDLGLARISNKAGVSVAVLPNGAVFAIEHRGDDDVTMINQVLGSAIDGGIGRMLLRTGAAPAAIIEAIGPRAKVRMGSADGQLHLGGRDPRRTSSRHIAPARRRARVGLARRGHQYPGHRHHHRRSPRAGPRPRHARIRHQQRSVRVAIHRPSYRPHAALGPGRDEPPESRAERQSIHG